MTSPDPVSGNGGVQREGLYKMLDFSYQFNEKSRSESGICLAEIILVLGQFYFFLPSAAWAAASLAIGTRKGLQLT